MKQESEIQKKINQAERNFMSATDQLTAAVRECFPVGSRVAVTLGKHRVVGEVLWHSSNYWRPGYMCILNLKSGKERIFSVLYYDVTPLGI